MAKDHELPRGGPGACLRAREKETRMSPSRAPLLSFPHYFQAPATQATEMQSGAFSDTIS